MQLFVAATAVGTMEPSSTRRKSSRVHGTSTEVTKVNPDSFLLIMRTFHVFSQRCAMSEGGVHFHDLGLDDRLLKVSCVLRELCEGCASLV